MTPSLVREEPDEVESLTSGFEAESGEAIPRLRLTRGPAGSPGGLFAAPETRNL